MIWQIPKEEIEAAETAGEPLLDHFYQNITEPFQMEFNLCVEGDIGFEEFTDSLVAHISEKAPWFFDPGAKTMGGPGFTAAGTTSKTTVQLEPGDYVWIAEIPNPGEYNMLLKQLEAEYEVHTIGGFTISFTFSKKVTGAHSNI